MMVNVATQQLESGNLRIDLRIPTAEAQTEHGTEVDFDQLDMMIIDQSLVPDDIDEWLNYVNTQGRKVGLINKSKSLPVIILGPSHPKAQLKRFRDAPIYALYRKPIERRGLMYSVSAGLNNPFSVYCENNIGWAEAKIPVNIAKDAFVEQISEFGCIIRHQRPVAPGTVLYLHKGIYENAPDESLCVRYYFSESHPEFKEEFLCSVLYFGIDESFLKFTRSWIRENAASSRASSD